MKEIKIKLLKEKGLSDTRLVPVFEYQVQRYNKVNLCFYMSSISFPELELSSKERYHYFIRKVKEEQLVWFVGSDGQSATCLDDDNRRSIPVWPADRFASLSLDGTWDKYEVTSVSLDSFFNWLTQLDLEDMYITVFPNLKFDAYVVPALKLKKDIESDSDL